MARFAAPLSAKPCALLKNNRHKAFRLEITRGDDPTWSCPDDGNSLHSGYPLHFTIERYRLTICREYRSYKATAAMEHSHPLES